MTTPITQRVAGLAPSAEPRQIRTPPKPTQPFQEVLRTGAQVLLAGASEASGLVGGPRLSRAIDAAQSRRSRTGGATGRDASDDGGSPVARAVGSGAGPDSSAGAGSARTELEAMRRLQQEGQKDSVQYLELQQEVQQANRRFTVASNLLKARHDTARAAINNLRS